MLSKNVAERLYYADAVAGAVLDLVSDLVMMNGLPPMEALETVHGSELYEALWCDEMWVYPSWYLYETFCRENGLESHLPTSEWNYPEYDDIGFLSEVFEAYRALTPRKISGYGLENVFQDQLVYENLLKCREKLAKRSLADIVLDIEAGLKRRDAWDERLRILPVYEETALERFFKTALKSD